MTSAGRRSPIRSRIVNVVLQYEEDIPDIFVKVSDAAFPDIHIFYTYIVMHFFTVPPQSKLHTNSLNPLG